MAAAAVRSNDLLHSTSMNFSEGLAKSVHISLQALLKILQYARDNSTRGGPATGQLMGMETDSFLDVTDFFPFAMNAADEMEQEEYQMDMIKSFREVNLDHSTVGWFITSSFAGVINNSLIETQMSYQSTIPNSVVIVIDLIRSSYGPPSLKALRLKSEFISLYGEKRPTAVPALLDIFEELPVTLSLSVLDKMFLIQLLRDKKLPCIGSASIPSIDHLISSIIVGNLLSTVDDVIMESGRLQHYLRSSTKQQQVLSNQLQRLKNESSQRQQASPDEDQTAVTAVLNNFRPLSEPSRISLALASSNLQVLLDEQARWSS